MCVGVWGGGVYVLTQRSLRGWLLKTSPLIGGIELQHCVLEGGPQHSSGQAQYTGRLTRARWALGEEWAWL